LTYFIRLKKDNNIYLLQLACSGTRYVKRSQVRR